MLKYSSYITIIRPNYSLNYEFLDQLRLNLHYQHLVLLANSTLCLIHNKTKLLFRNPRGLKHFSVQGYNI